MRRPSTSSWPRPRPASSSTGTFATGLRPDRSRAMGHLERVAMGGMGIALFAAACFLISMEAARQTGEALFDWIAGMALCLMLASGLFAFAVAGYNIMMGR